MKNNKNSGFTLIELVVVIVILALLAVVALPRFMSYSREAHEARADAAFSSFINAVHMYHSKWLTEGEPTGVVDYATSNIYPSVAGYPLTLRSGNKPDHLEGDDCVDLWRSLLNTDLTIEHHSGPIYGHEADIIGWYQDTDVCYYYYTKGYSKGEDLPRLNYNVRSGEFSRETTSPAE